MKFLRPCLLLISILLFGWLLMSNVNLINVAATLNESEINSQTAAVNSFTDIGKLKEFTIEKINYIEVIRNRFSENAYVRIGILVSLIIIQVVLFRLRRNVSTVKQ